MASKLVKVTQKAKVEAAIISNDTKDNHQCNAAPNCGYAQKGPLNHGNFVRHFRTLHQDKLQSLGFEPEKKSIEAGTAGTSHQPSTAGTSQPSTSGTNPPAIGTGKHGSPVRVEKKAKRARITIEIDRQQAILGTLQLVTTNSLPLQYPEWEGFRNLAGPTWIAFQMTMNRKSMADFVTRAAAIMREIITKEMVGKSVNFIIDSASRRNHHSFGIAAQYYDEHQQNVLIRSLAIKEMINRQTANYLAETIKREAMDRFQVQPNQLYTVVADNAPNITASVRKLGNILKKLIDNGATELLKRENDAVSSFLATVSPQRILDLDAMDEAADEDDGEHDQADPNGDPEDVEWSEEPDADDDDDVDEETGDFEFESTRCAAHSCQLAVWDVLKKSQKRIETIKKLVKNSKLVKYRETFLNEKAHFAPVCNATRWNAVYLMLKALKDQRAFYLLLENKFNELTFSKHWTFIDEYCEALEPVFFLTIYLQREHVPLSEFYTQWLISQAQLHKMKSNKLAKKLHDAMDNRLKKLTQSIQFKAALYFDPRYNYLGSNKISDKEAIQKFLLQLWTKINPTEEQDEQQESEPPTSNDDSFIVNYLDDYFEQDTVTASAPAAQPQLAKIHRLLKELEFQPKVKFDVNSSFDVIKHWAKRRTSHPELYRLATVVLSAPSTQVIIERSFSALKLILSDLRQRLSDPRIQDLMILKLNPDLLQRVVQILDGEI